jgi:predicted nucleic acid-binding Zn ribbon protein
MRPLQDAVPGVLSQILRKAPLSPGKVDFAWRAAVGPALARISTVHLEDQILFVEAAGNQWVRELERSSQVILERMRALLGHTTVASIKVRALPNFTPGTTLSDAQGRCPADD